MISCIQASDKAAGSTNHGFLSKYMPSQSESSENSIGSTGKFLVHHLTHMEHGGQPEALSDRYGLADDASVTVGSSHPDGNLEGDGVIAKPKVDSRFRTYIDKPVQPTAHIQDTMNLIPALEGALRTSKDFESQKITDENGEKDVHKLFTNESNKPIGLFAISVALLSFASMVGVRMQRGMQPAIALASRGRYEIDMAVPMATVSSYNSLDPKSRCAIVRIPEQDLQCSERVLAQAMHNDTNIPFALWDPLGLGEGAFEAHVKKVCESELQHGRLAMTAVFLVAAENANEFDVPPRPTVGDHVSIKETQNNVLNISTTVRNPAATSARIAELKQQREQIDAELASLEDGQHGSQRTPKQQIRALYDAFNARDGRAVTDLLAEDVVYEDLLLGETTICRGKAAFSSALEWHPAFVSKKLNLPFDLQLVVDSVACDGSQSVGVEWHVEIDGKPFPLSRGLSLATTNAEGKLVRVVDIAEAPWRVVGLLIRPLLTASGAGAAALGIGGLGYLMTASQFEQFIILDAP
jgi:ketosteroid isomerase-like protein